MMSDKNNNYDIIENILFETGLTTKFKHNDNQHWDSVLNSAEYASVEYTSYQELYQYEYFKGLDDNVLNISIIIYHNEKASAIWPLMLDTNNSEPIKTKNNEYCGIIVPPLFIRQFPKKSQRRIIKLCIKFLNNVVETFSGTCWRSSEVSVNGKGLSQWYQLMMENNANLDRVNNEMYVDLSLSTKSYRKFIRKSYRPLISLGYKSWRTLVMNKCNTNAIIWEKFKNLHKYVAGKVTRSDTTWELQYNGIKSDDAFLVYINNSDDRMIGGALFDTSANECFYGVGAYDRNFLDQPFGHMIQYHAIKEMKEKELKWYRLGLRHYRNDQVHIDNKRVNISNFTQGFLTHMFPRVQLVIKI